MSVFAGVWLASLLAVALCAQTASEPQALSARVVWLRELGTESLAAGSEAAVRPAEGLVTSVPGAAYVFDLRADGSLHKKLRLGADPAAAYGMAVAGGALALADREGTLRVWDFAAGGGRSLRWARDVLDRVTSVAWDGGPLVLAATWKGQLVAFAAQDGTAQWSADLGGRADAPPVFDGRDVYVATKAKALLRIDTSSGRLRWKVALPGVAVHPPVLLHEAPRDVLVGTWDGQLTAIETLRGRIRWSAPLGARLSGPPLAGPGLVAAVTTDGTVHGYAPAGRPLWTAPESADGPATLLWHEPAGPAARLLSVSRVVVSLDASTGKRLDDYPRGAVAELRRRFADAMLEGVKTYSEAEKTALQEKEAFEIAGAPFAPARLSGRHLVLGTEDGWTYVFDAARLRPLARRRAGEPVSGAPFLLERSPSAAASVVVATAGEEVHALDGRTGETIWKRAVGADAIATGGAGAVGVLAGGRVHAIAPDSGGLDWSLRGSFRLLAPASVAQQETGGPPGPSVPWLVDDGQGNLRVLLPPGRAAGDPLPIGGELLGLAAIGARSWLAATRQGALFQVDWQDEHLVRLTEKTWPEPLTDFQVASGRVLVRTAAGTLASLDAVSLEEVFRLGVEGGDRIQIAPEDQALLVLAAAEVRVHDWATGALRARRPLAPQPLAARLSAGALVSLDGRGDVRRTSLADGPSQTAALGLPIARATAIAEGFLVATAAGEVGLVEVDAGGPSAGTVNREE